MLRILQNRSADGAKSYYSTSDYYTEGQDLTGLWRGHAATRLGLAGEIRKEDWDSLCDNVHPGTGQQLTPRHNSDRRVGYDLNFHAPKSVSLLYGLTRDERILTAFRSAVDQTMQEIEAETKTRVRKNGSNEDRVSASLVWGEYIHTTARPVDGVPDPHLHAHCFTFNVTFDSAENRWKAIQLGDVKRDAPYFEAKFHSRLASNLMDQGIPVHRTKTRWEIDGFEQSTLDRLSRRTQQIEERAKELGIEDADEKSKLGAITRERKQRNLSTTQLQTIWQSRMTPQDLVQTLNLAQRIGSGPLPRNRDGIEESVSQAVDHCFERKSVVPERMLLAEAIKRNYGQSGCEEVEQSVKRRDLLRADRDGRIFVTTRHVLNEEKRMLDFARRGRGTCQPLGDLDHAPACDGLTREQRHAVWRIVDSRDRVILVRGVAGSGKTRLMREAVDAIESHGNRVNVFAPTATASWGVLAKEGFPDAQTVSRLLCDPAIQQKAKGSTLWVDEAGLLGVESTAKLFDLAEKLDCRVILSGDRYQHRSVDRGAAFQLLETEAGLIATEVRDIQRQRGDYKRLVTALSQGKTEQGFRQLDRLGWIHEVPDESRHALMAKEYVDTIAAGKSALAISPTHREGEKITAAIRQELKAMKVIKGSEHTLNVLQPARWTETERADAVSYSPGDVIVFQQNATGFRKGQRLCVDDGPLPLEQAERFAVFHQTTLPVAKGDLLRVTQNGKTKDGKHRLNNGAIVKVRRFTPNGHLLLTNGWVIDRDFGHLAHGFCVTSHASQGTTVDRVFVAQGSESFAASSREQFYVSISRGRERAVVFSDDKDSLLEAVAQSEDRMSATELVNERHRHSAIVAHRRDLAEMKPEARPPQRVREGVVHE